MRSDGKSLCEPLGLLS